MRTVNCDVNRSNKGHLMPLYKKRNGECVGNDDNDDEFRDSPFFDVIAAAF